MDYCASCGEAAKKRCTLCGSTVCRAHSANYPIPIYKHFAKSQGNSIVLTRHDGSSWKVSDFDQSALCGPCVESVIKDAIPRLAEDLIRMHGSKERAFLYVAKNFEWDDIGFRQLGSGYRSSVHADAIIEAIDGHRPSWLGLTTIDSLARLYAERMVASGQQPPEHHFINRFRKPSLFRKSSNIIGIAKVWEVQYFDGDYGTRRVYIRADGCILPTNLSRPGSTEKDEKTRVNKICAWAQESGSGSIQVEHPIYYGEPKSLEGELIKIIHPLV